MKKNVWRTLMILVLCCSLVLNVFAATVTTENEDGSITTRTETSNTVTEGDKTIVTDTVKEQTNGTTVHEDGSKTNWVAGSETVTQTETMKGLPQTEEVYAGSVEVTFDDNGTGAGQAAITAPTAPEDAQNIVTGEDSLSWNTSDNTGVIAGEGDGTDVDGDGITDSVTTQTTTNTTTTVEWTDRTVEATLQEGETEETVGDADAGAITGAALPEGADWTELSAENQAKIAKIAGELYFGTEDAARAAATQLALDALLNGRPIPADADPAAAEAARALIEAANADSDSAATPAVPEISISNVSLTVNEKVDGADDLYDAGVKFDVFVTENAFTHTLVVIVKQNGVEVGKAYLNENAENITVNPDGSYSVNIRNMNLLEGVEVDMEITVDGVQDLESKTFYAYTETTRKPVDLEDQDLTGATSHTGNDKGAHGGETSQGKNLIADTSSWDKGTHDQTFEVPGGTIRVKAAGTRNGHELVEITVTETVEAESIVVKAGNGYVKYTVPEGKLYAGVTYTVENVYNTATGKNAGISHVCVYGTGEGAETPAVTVTETFIGVADESRSVGLKKDLSLSFNVEEAVLTSTVESEKITVTTREWEDEDTVAAIPDPTPEEETEVEKTETEETEDPKPENKETEETEDPKPVDPPKENTVVPNNNGLTDIEEEDVPLADVPNTGDASFVFVIMAILSACGLAYLALTKKRENV